MGVGVEMTKIDHRPLVVSAVFIIAIIVGFAMGHREPTRANAEMRTSTSMKTGKYRISCSSTDCYFIDTTTGSFERIEDMSTWSERTRR